MKNALLVGLIWWSGVFLTRAAIPQQEYVLSGFAQGTSYHIKYYSDKAILQNDIDSILTVIDLSMSLYKDDSLIKQFNNEGSSFVRMDEHMKRVVEESFRVNALSNGFFDITVFPLVDLWGFGPDGFVSAPTPQQVDSVRQFVGMDKISVKNDTLYKFDPRVRIDLNGIAQGYTVDVICDYLMQRGVNNYLVEIGGEVRTKGAKPDGPFKIMLDETNDFDARYAQPIVILRDKAVTTSSVREKNYRLGDQLVSHHIHPITGRPIATDNISVTVIADNAMLADAIDNYLMALDPDDAMTFVETLDSVEACIYYQTDKGIKALHSSGFNNYLYN